MESKARLIKPDKVEEKTAAEKLSDFIAKNRIVFLSIIIALVVVLAGVGIYTFASSNYAEKSARAMEEAGSRIAGWNQESDETKKTELEGQILADLDEIAKKWPKSFAAQQALYTAASLQGFKKDWAKAETYAVSAAERKPESYLAPLALELAAIAAEEQGNRDAAIGYYEKLVSKYKEDTPNLAHAHFSIGRLKEAAQDYSAALEHYNTLLSDFSGSDWALLAKNRVVYLKTQGYDS